MDHHKHARRRPAGIYEYETHNFDDTIYKVPLRDVPTGVTWERNKNRCRWCNNTTLWFFCIILLCISHVQQMTLLFTFFLIDHHVYFPAQIVGGFTLSGLLLDKPWSQLSSFPPPGTLLHFLSRIGFSTHCSSIFIKRSFISRFPLINFH